MDWVSARLLQHNLQWLFGPPVLCTIHWIENCAICWNEMAPMACVKHPSLVCAHLPICLSVCEPVQVCPQCPADTWQVDKTRLKNTISWSKTRELCCLEAGKVNQWESWCSRWAILLLKSSGHAWRSLTFLGDTLTNAELTNSSLEA